MSLAQVPLQMPQGREPGIQEAAKEYTLTTMVDPYGGRSLLSSHSLHNGYRPKSPCKLSKLLLCLSKQRWQREACTGVHLQAVPHGEGSSSFQLQLLPGTQF